MESRSSPASALHGRATDTGVKVEGVPSGLRSLPALRFILHFDKRGGVNYGATGMSHHVTASLEAAGLVSVFYYKPLNLAPQRRGSYRVIRHYRAVVRGDRTGLFAERFRAELRGRNLASINGLDDGVGAVAFNADWRSRRVDILAAASAAWSSLSLPDD